MDVLVELVTVATFVAISTVGFFNPVPEMVIDCPIEAELGETEVITGGSPSSSSSSRLLFEQDEIVIIIATKPAKSISAQLNFFMVVLMFIGKPGKSHHYSQRINIEGT
jgi:hypothetical protein